MAATEEEQRTSLPPASGIPYADEETGQEIISFPLDGKTYHVKVRADSYGRQLEAMRGTSIETFEEPIVDEDGNETGEKRTVMRRDPYAEGHQAKALFDNYVLEINGVPWSRGQNVMSLKKEFVLAFMEAFAPKLNPRSDIRKKSKTR
jgi:hypothetical protein